MARNRIVIDLNAQQSAPSRLVRPVADESRRGVARPLLIIAIIFVIFIGGAAGGAYFWWQHYQGSPAYSLALLADAAQRNDTATIDSILDTDKITDDFVSQVRQRASGSYSSAITSAWPVQIAPAIPAITAKLKPTVHDELVKELQRLTSIAAGKPFVLVALAVTSFADIKQENNVAHAQVNIKDEQLELTMEPQAGRWRIVSIKDDALAKRIADGVVRTLPSNAPQLQDKIRKELDKLQTRER
jgi:hypothetical protein